MARTMTAAAASELFKKQLAAKRKVKRRRKQRAHYVLTCAWCLSAFGAAREHAKFCSSKCRTAMHRLNRIRPGQGALLLASTKKTNT